MRNKSSIQTLLTLTIMGLSGLLCIATLFVTSHQFTDPFSMPKWYAGAAVGSLLVMMACICPRAAFPPIPWIFGVVLIGCTAMALLGVATLISERAPKGFYGIRAGFDNPAGFASAMCFAFPLTLYFLRKERQRWARVSAAIAGLFLIMGVVFSCSRTALITLLIVTIIWLYFQRHIHLGQVAILTLCACALLAALYWLKKDSANGRLLVWYCSWQMIKQHPITGYGLHGFVENYMNFQATYFKYHQQSHFGLLATNTFRPFNEYLSLVISFGISGLLLLLTTGVMIGIKFHRHKTEETITAVTCLIAIAVFSISSYPLSYPFTLVVLGMSLFILFQPEQYVLSRRFRGGLKVVLLSFSVITLYWTYKLTIAEMQWRELTHRNGAAAERELFDSYRRLWPTLKGDYPFVYNAAAQLNSHGLYNQSLAIADIGSMLCADYDMQLIMADNYFQLKKYTESENRYQWASYMCPNRFLPLYGLFNIYLATGQKDRASTMALIIKNKPVKIKSSVVSDIQAEISRYLNSIQSRARSFNPTSPTYFSDRKKSPFGNILFIQFKTKT